MILLERQKKILSLLKQQGAVTVSELTQFLDASAATVRRDLELLERENLLRRTYGGAIEYQIGYEPSLMDRVTQCMHEKAGIARQAASLVTPNDIVALDAGTTTCEIARLLVAIEPLTIITPSLTIAEIFAEADNNEHTILLPGGILRAKTHSLVGELAERTLLNYRCNKAFIGCQSITHENGAMNVNLLAIGTKQALASISQNIIVVADHTKFGRTSLATVVATNQINTLITDSKTPESTLMPYRESGIQVIVAP